MDAHMDPNKFVASASEKDKCESFVALERLLRKGTGVTKTIQFYDETCETYEKHLLTARYRGPQVMVTVMEELFPSDRHKLKILDAASGTGLSGEAMYKAGFTNIDAVDASQGMLDVAKGKNIYNRFICQFLGENKLHEDIKDRIYDVVTLCGVVGENHVPYSALEELVSFVKPGGVLLLVTREFVYTHVDQHGRTAPEVIKKLTDQGRWRQESVKVVQDYLFGEEGLIFTYRII